MTDNLNFLSVKNSMISVADRQFGAFNLEVVAGEKIAILGASGAGKTTLLKLLAGDLSPTTQSTRQGIFFKGKPLSEWSNKTLSHFRAVLSQSQPVAFGFNSELVVALGRASRESDPHCQKIIQEALQLAAADHLHGRRIDTLSGGEQARVHLARVFAQLWDKQRGLILLDEPLAALDPKLQIDILRRLQTFACQGEHTLIAVLHDINHALKYFDRLWLVQNGQLLADVPASLAALPLLEQVYDVKMDCYHHPSGAWMLACHE